MKIDHFSACPLIILWLSLNCCILMSVSSWSSFGRKY